MDQVLLMKTNWNTAFKIAGIYLICVPESLGSQCLQLFKENSAVIINTCKLILMSGVSFPIAQVYLRELAYWNCSVQTPPDAVCQVYRILPEISVPFIFIQMFRFLCRSFLLFGNNAKVKSAWLTQITDEMDFYIFSNFWYSSSQYPKIKFSIFTSTPP